MCVLSPKRVHISVRACVFSVCMCVGQCECGRGAGIKEALDEYVEQM